ncbi:hypothetical protein GCM10007933_02640 [Zoogloea oryzae]|uniref:Uncharacterized protein n=1 Tax=Zoogloea oryzae TaxID=310767 RepID=A0ABQ6F5I9_9RHOO|nr:hypothetical protein [Zoogloea oryzae]GLT20812.1 hypothetical protein GCM10007933_02640 [Zoogloea oryzae]
MDANATNHGLEVSRAPHGRGITAYIVPDDATLFEIAKEVADKGLRLASNFSRFVICREIPPSFHEVVIDLAELEKMQKEAA